MLYSATEIKEQLRSKYPGIQFLEADHSTSGRYGEKHIIVFGYADFAGEHCVLKFYSLQHIPPDRVEQETASLLDEFRTIKLFGSDPQIVRMYEANELRIEGRLIGFYITMEKFDSTLADLLGQGRTFSDAEVRSFLEQMDRVLYRAHYELDEPVVHSDIKPANIGVRRGRGGYEYALMDFDVSVRLERKSTDGHSFTLSNKASLRGITLAYAPPEQVLAYLHRSGNISNRVDVYAVGAIAMQMLTGRAPEKDPDQMYYRLPFDGIPIDWRGVFDLLCAPDVKQRPRRVGVALQEVGRHDAATASGSQAGDEQTLLVRNSGKTGMGRAGSGGRSSGGGSGPGSRPIRAKGAAGKSRWHAVLLGAIVLCGLALGALVFFYLDGSRAGQWMEAPDSKATLLDSIMIELRTAPGGVPVSMDGKPLGRSNEQGLLRASVSPGRRQVELDLAGYEPEVRSIEVGSEEGQVFAFQLIPRSGLLRLRVEPANATVRIEGDQVDASGPLELAVGEYRLHVSRSGYGTFEEQIRIEHNRELVLPVVLAPRPGSLAFTVTPAGARSVLRGSRGQEMARWTGNRRMEDLEAGTYRIEVEAPGHEAHNAQVRIDRGQVRSLSVTLEAHTGILDVTTSPSNAQVRLLGSAGREVARWTGSRRMEDLAVGGYKLEGSAGDHHSQTRDIEVRRSEETSVRMELEPEYLRDTRTAVVEVRNPQTGRVWMDRNLGASRAATSSTDSQSYGDLYQWGREADGHQRRNSQTTSTLSGSDRPGHGSFILAPAEPYDWRSPQNDNLWQGVNGVNNPCPAGYRLPTEAEWIAERNSWASRNASGALSSPLKLPMAGLRSGSSGSLFNVGSFGYYWSGPVSGGNARFLYFNSSNAGMLSNLRAGGFAVRCTKD